MKIGNVTLLLALVASIAWGLIGGQVAAQPPLQQDQEQAIDAYVRAQWQASDIPGLSVAVFQGDQLLYRAHHGFADLEAQQPLTSATRFEIGSNSKAFTGLAILQLEQQGALSRQDPVSKHLPWFWAHYRGQPAAITIDQLLHHTSGIPYETIGDIPISSAADALAGTVRLLVGSELKHRPGQTFEYATINYDVLGLIIEQVTGVPYEQHIRDQILLPLGLTNTVVGRHSLRREELPVGYKMCFGRPCRYDAPDYRGNTPAGYIISTQEDMVRWAQIQLGIVPAPPALRDLIQRAHMPDRSVLPDFDGSSYAAGWNVFPIGDGLVSHDGANPNFSSYIGLLPAQRVGVVVLANMNYGNTHAIGQGIVNLVLGRELPKTQEDQYAQIDRVASFLVFLCVPALLVLLWFTINDLRQIAQRRRSWVQISLKKLGEIGGSLLFLGLLAWALYDLPSLVFYGFPWSFVQVWVPDTVQYAVGAIALTAGATYLYYLITTLTRGAVERPYYWLTVFSSISGVGNAFIIVVINETFVRTDNLTNGLLFYFALGIITYVLGQRFVRRKIITLTNDMLFAKRVELLRALQVTSYRDFEALERGALLSGLNNDTEVISNSVNTGITGLTNLVTLICCLAYLGFMNVFGLLIAIIVIIGTAGIYFLAGQRAESAWERTRDSQNRFFQLVNDLLDGFKELQMSDRRRRAFQRDIEESCAQYRETRTQGELGFANVFVIGELLFVIVIGFVVFLYPYIFPDIGDDVLRNYVFVFLYMTGPVNAVLEAYPQIIRMRISWRRIVELSQQLAKTRGQRGELAGRALVGPPLRLELQDVQFRYTEKSGKTFVLGPISYTFSSGELIFITGGNGSGKSTLARLLTGLYAPDAGRICINGSAATPEQLNEYFSTVFSDFYLFEKLYGIDTQAKQQETQEYLKLLRIADKVDIQDGAFSTTQLSTGQRKRLALLISYLEDRPICLYDEWAADQDPEYRAYFYNTILPALRGSGKCVIVITHDDRYFDLADKVLKLEVGKMVPALLESR